jgi:hypothetical protein
MEKNLDDFINSKLGISKPRNNEVKFDALYELNNNIVNRTVFFVDLKLQKLDYDSLCLSITKSGGILSIRRDSADVVVTDDKLPEVENNQLIYSEDRFIADFISGTIEPKSYKKTEPIQKDIPKPTETKSNRIIPLDNSAFKKNSLQGKRIAFVGVFRHFDSSIFASTVMDLGGVVVSPNEYYDWFVCGKNTNPLEYTESLVKVITETDFIRMITN